MSFSHVLTIQINNNGTVVGSSQTITGGAEANLDEPIPQDSTDLEILYSLDVSQIKSIVILADQAMTLKTNSSSVPDETLSLLANDPYEWHTGSLHTNLLATDITSLFMTNTTAGTLKIESTIDPTA